MSHAFLNQFSHPRSASVHERNGAPVAKLVSAHSRKTCLRFSALPSFLLAFIVGVHPSLLFAQDTANWNGGTGFWSNSGNWTCVIGGQSQACVPNGTMVTVVTAGTANVDINAAVGLLTVDRAGSLGITSGTQLSSSGDLYAGGAGQGTLTIQNRGVVSVGGNAFLGAGAGSNGTVTVSDVSSRWSVSNQLAVASDGQATLTIQNGGTVTSGYGVVGGGPGSTGTVTVTDTGSQWSVPNNLTIASGGQGTLTIQNSGVVTAGGDAYWGTSAGSNGTVTIQSSGVVTVGGNAFLGAGAGSNGTVGVTDAGSRWSVSNQLAVASDGQATLTIQNGGTVTSGYGVVGGGAGSTGTVTVTDTGSQWSVPNNLAIASGGHGTLTIQNGGTVTSQFGSVAVGSGSTGTATVNGVTSNWTNSADFHVGDGGQGTVTIQNGGVVTVGGNAFLGTGAGSNGTVTLVGGGALTVMGGYTQNAGATNFSGAGQLRASAVTINGGGLQGTGTVAGPTTIAAGASMAPGADSSSGGTLTFGDGGLTLNGAFSEFITPTGFGAAVVRGSTSLNASTSTMDIRQDPNYAPPVGTTLVVLSADSPVAGRFRFFKGATFNGKSEYWQVRYNQNGNNVVLVAMPGCGDARTDIIAEYANFGVMDVSNGRSLFLPSCDNFTSNAFNTAHPPLISFATLIQDDQYAFALIRGPLYIDGSYGAEKLYTDLTAHFGGTPVVTSGYRNPALNFALSQKARRTSRHMFGDAVDFDNPEKTSDHCEEMQMVALNEKPTPVTPIFEPCEATASQGYHLHVEWRTGPYAR